MLLLILVQAGKLAGRAATAFALRASHGRFDSARTARPLTASLSATLFLFALRHDHYPFKSFQPINVPITIAAPTASSLGVTGKLSV